MLSFVESFIVQVVGCRYPRLNTMSLSLGKTYRQHTQQYQKKERSASFQPQVTNVLPALLLGAASDDVVTWLEFT